jgi:hypothetical protein
MFVIGARGSTALLVFDDQTIVQNTPAIPGTRYIGSRAEAGSPVGFMPQCVISG